MTDNILEKLIEIVLPYIINLLEIMGIIIVTWSGITAFFKYIKGIVAKRKIDFLLAFSQGLATGLEFKMGAEILKTVLVREMSELLVLGAVILLRAILSILIHFEIKHNKNGD